VTPRSIDALLESLEATTGLDSKAILKMLERDYQPCHLAKRTSTVGSCGFSRAFLLHDYVVVPDALERARLLRSGGVNSRKQVVLEREPRWTMTSAAAQATHDETRFRVDEPGRVELDVTTASNAFLVLADSYYPGWKLGVDGMPAEILAADGFVRAVAVTAGSHRICFNYVRGHSFWACA